MLACQAINNVSKLLWIDEGSVKFPWQFVSRYYNIYSARCRIAKKVRPRNQQARDLAQLRAEAAESDLIELIENALRSRDGSTVMRNALEWPWT